MSKVWKLSSLMSVSALALSLGAIGSAKANVIWNYSPDATHAALYQTAWGNQAGGQNFLEFVSFATTVTLGGMDIFSGTSFGTLGQLATVKIFGSSGGSPSGLLNTVSTAIDAIDSQGTTTQSSLSRKHADFAPIVLGAGSYWIGMSGTSSELALASLTNVQDNKMYQLSGNTFGGLNTLGDMAFTLYDTSVTPVPEPLSVALLGVGVLTVGAAARRRAGGYSALS